MGMPAVVRKAWGKTFLSISFCSIGRAYARQPRIRILAPRMNGVSWQHDLLNVVTRRGNGAIGRIVRKSSLFSLMEHRGLP